jgi:transcriptional regulator with XRE-family HTH domain
MNVGAKIKARRKELGMSVQELSDKLGMTRQNVYNLENHEHIHTKTLEQLCEILKVELPWFFSDNHLEYMQNKQGLRKEVIQKRIQDLEMMMRILERELTEMREIVKKLN